MLYYYTLIKRGDPLAKLILTEVKYMKQHKSSITFCKHFNTCSGCRIDVNDPAPPVWNDVLTYLNRKNLFSVSLYDGPRLKWRSRAKLAVRGSSDQPLIGLYKERSHDVEPIPFCEIHHPKINQAVEMIKNMIQEHHLTPYNEQTGQGDLRYLQFVVERKTGKIQASFVLNFQEQSKDRSQKWKSLLGQLGDNDKDDFWHSLWINFNDRPTNTIFGPRWFRCYGEEWLWEQFGEISVCYHPASFAQANLDLFEKMLHSLKSLVELGSNIAEYYAGVGVIGLFLASKSGWVRCAEINPLAERCFIEASTKLTKPIESKISFHTGSADKLLSIMEGAETVIVDPPRKGLDAGLLKALKKPSTVKQIIYISCGWEAFKLDCDELMEAGWKLSNAEGYLFFPGTDQIEILANFKR